LKSFQGVDVTHDADKDHEYDELAVSLVLDGHRMKLRGEDRAEALRRMTAYGMSREVMAARIKMSGPAQLSRWAKTHGVELTPRTQPHWTYEWIASHRGGDNSRRWSNGDFTYDSSRSMFDA
jgi:hypothetical protein